MADGWEQFIGGPAKPFRERLHATLGPKRRILLNANLYDLWGRPEAVHLFFDRATRRIALRPAPPNDGAAFPVNRIKKGSSASAKRILSLVVGEPRPSRKSPV